ncbi:MAG: cation transporter [Microbacteriaceae bacterium]|nr:cation transporter [Microbacteriaceae bacterium]
MKHLFRTTLTLCALALGVTAATAAPRNVKLEVENVTCVSCAPMVKRTLARVPGVSQVGVIERGGIAMATVTYDDEKVTTDALVAATTNAGYPSRVVEN